MHKNIIIRWVYVLFILNEFDKLNFAKMKLWDFTIDLTNLSNTTVLGLSLKKIQSTHLIESKWRPINLSCKLPKLTS